MLFVIEYFINFEVMVIHIRPTIQRKRYLMAVCLPIGFGCILTDKSFELLFSKATKEERQKKIEAKNKKKWNNQITIPRRMKATQVKVLHQDITG